MQRRPVTFARACGALCWSFAAAMAFSASAAGPVVSDTGFEIIARTLSPSLYWIDSDRLLFEGIDRKEMDAALAGREPNRFGHLKKIYLWDTRAGSARLYADGSALCVANGVIRYAVQVDGTASKEISRRGLSGQETELERPLRAGEKVASAGSDARVYSSFNCAALSRSALSPPAAPGRRILVLRAGDGYLDAGPIAVDERIAEIRIRAPGYVTLYRPGSPSGIKLPFTLAQGPGYPVYSEYLGAYVTLPDPKSSRPGVLAPWPRGLPFTVYSFRASGEAGEVVIPYGEWGGPMAVQPTSAGWMFAGQGSPAPKAGLFMFSSGSVRRLDSGFVYEIAVTPDGCRAAVAIKNRLLEINAPTNLKIVDLCAEGR